MLISLINWRKLVALLALVTLPVAVSWAQSPFPAANPTGTPSAGPLPAPIYWGQDLFLIPYQWDSVRSPHQAQSVKLFLSRDHGRGWKDISSAKPEVQFFTYHAPADGEYWFSMQTIDASGHAWPEGPHPVELRVIVDTQNPQIVSCEAHLTAAGIVTATWQASDTHIDPQKIQLQYRSPDRNEWIDAPMGSRRQPAADQVAGQAAWKVAPGTPTVWVRLSVRDLAGNGREAGAEARLGDLPLSGALPAFAASNGTPPPAPLARRDSTGWTTHHSSSLPSSSPHQSSLLPTGPALLHAPHHRQAAVAPPASQSWPSQGESLVPLGSPRLAITPAQPFQSFQPQFAAANTVPTQQPVAAPLAARPPMANPFQIPHATTAALPARTASANPFPRSALEVPPLIPRIPTANHLQTSPFPSTPPTREPRGLPAQQPSRAGAPQYLNSLDFEIGYNVDTAGTFGVTRVELWATSDGGRRWKRIAVDSDNRSPIQASVSQPGDYGLKIVIETAGGIDPLRPRPGDAPEMTVRIDTTPPIAQLTGVEQGEGYFADQLHIRWQPNPASDGDIVTLSYSNRPTGPWIVAASNLANNGRYAWRLSRHLPTRFYVQLQVRDQAGNIATDQTAVPVAIHLATPSGQLESIRPLGR